MVAAYHHFENGFDDKLDYYTLEEAEKAAQGYVDAVSYTHLDVYKRQSLRSWFASVFWSVRAIRKPNTCLLYTSRTDGNLFRRNLEAIP